MSGLWLARCLVVAGAALWSSAGRPAAAGELGPELLGGVDDPTDAAVGAILDEPAGLAARTGCTGTLISPVAVLTAAHCVKLLPPPLSFSLAETPAAGSDGLAVRAVHVHPDFVIAAGTQPLHDLALIELSAPVSDVTPEALPPAASVLSVGDTLTLAGYGRESDAAAAGTRSSGLAHITAVADSEITVGLPADAHGCEGDSGGPAFAAGSAAGTRALVALLSRAADPSSDCGGGAIYTRVDAHRAWIDRTLADIDAGRAAGCSIGAGRPIAGSPTEPVLLVLLACLCRWALRLRRRMA